MSPFNKQSAGNMDCQTCRARHYDCDRTQPVCRRCSDSGRTCVPAFNVRFRRSKTTAADAGLHSKGKLIFGREQEWVQTPKTLSFVDETQSVGRSGESTRQSNNVECSPCNSQTPAQSDFPDCDSTEDQSDLVMPNEVHNRPASVGSNVSLRQLTSPLSQHSDVQDKAGNRGRTEHPLNNIHKASALLTSWSPNSSNTSRQATLHRDSNESGTITRHESDLLHYFRLHIGRVWFEVTDPGFTSEVLRLAPTSQLLLYSLLATASIHKSRRTSDANTIHRSVVEAEHFHEKCVGLLLPMLCDKSLITDGIFLACSTILRFYEEISATVHGRDDARHLLGGYASIEEFQKQAIELDSLSNAAFWIHQRQDLIAAVVNHRVPKTNYDHTGLDRSCDPADRLTWTKRGTCIHAEVIMFCFGSSRGSTDDFKAVMSRLEQWNICKPDEFTPVLYREHNPLEGRPFPDICFTLDDCAMAMAYHYFSILLMAIHDPTVPRLGPALLESQKKVKEEVIYYLRLLCGIACSNPVSPARTVICVAISQCGTWITDTREQKAMLEVLQMVDREDTWPTLSAQETLKVQWGSQC